MIHFSGSIPKEICYIFSEEIVVTVGSNWAESEANTIDCVLDTIPAEPQNNKSILNASQYLKKLYIDHKINKKVIPNTPIKNIRFLSSFWAPSKSFKVLIDNHVVNLKQDILIDTILKEGIAPGGILQGEFIWAKVRGEIQLVKIGSELHKRILNYEDRRKLKPIRKNDFQVGGIYQTKSNYKSVFLGYVNTVKYGNIKKIIINSSASSSFEHKKINKGLFFYDLWDDGDPHRDDMLSALTESTQVFRFSVKISHSFIEKIDEIDVPKDFIKNIRSVAIKFVKNQIVEYSNTKSNFHKMFPSFLTRVIVHNSPLINMYNHDSSPVEPFNIDKYLAFL